jgi:hypothetical protein
MRSWPVLAALTLVSVSAFAQTPGANADLARAQKSLEELRFSEAGKSLDAAWLTAGNDRPTVLEILKLQAVVAASLGQADRARTLFRTLLYLAPDFALPEGDLGPKVLSLYYEARGRVSVEGALRFEPGPIARDARQVRQISVQLTDTQRLAKNVRFHSRAPVLSWAERIVPVEGNAAALSVELPAVEWWAELLGEKDRVLSQVGSADQPILTAKAAALEPDPDQPQAGGVGGALPNLKPVAYGVAGAGAVAGIVGLVFGIRSNNQRNQIEGAARDADGRVIGITREKALSVNAQLRTSATAANALFVTSAVLIGTGVVLYFVSPDVKVTASPAGVALGGSLP